MSEVVSNASPLIVLAKSGHLDILPRLFDSVLVPGAVVDEICAGPPEDPMRQVVHALPWLRSVRLDAELTPLAYWRLGRGESEVLEYARLHPGVCALLDDRAARKAADALGIRVFGTLGVLAKAAAVDARFSFADAVGCLRSAGFRLDEALVLRVCETLKPWPPG